MSPEMISDFRKRLLDVRNLVGAFACGGLRRDLAAD